MGVQAMPLRRHSLQIWERGKKEEQERTDPDRHIHTLSVTIVILSEARFATYVPVEVRESAPRTTPPSYWHAMMVVCGLGKVGRDKKSQSNRVLMGAFEHGQIARAWTA